MLTPVDLPKPPEASVSALAAALAALAEDGAPVSRDAALGAFRRHLARIQQHVQHAFEQDQITGLQAARLLGKLTDGLISALYEHATSDTGFGEPEHLSVAGTGGYGRGVLAPFSDIDLLFLTAAEPSRQTLQVVEYMLYFLWDLGREGRPRHALDRGLPGRRRQGHHHPHRAARFTAHRRRRARCSPISTPASARPARMPASPSTSPPSRPNAPCATAATATARSSSSRT